MSFANQKPNLWKSLQTRGPAAFTTTQEKVSVKARLARKEQIPLGGPPRLKAHCEPWHGLMLDYTTPENEIARCNKELHNLSFLNVPVSVQIAPCDQTPSTRSTRSQSLQYLQEEKGLNSPSLHPATACNTDLCCWFSNTAPGVHTSHVKRPDLWPCR